MARFQPLLRPALRWHVWYWSAAAALLALAGTVPAEAAGPPGICTTPPWWWTPPSTWAVWWQPCGCGPRPVGYNGRVTNGGDTFAYGCPAPEEWRAICRLYESGPPPSPKYLCTSVNDPMGTQIPTGQKCTPNPDALNAALLTAPIGSGLQAPPTHPNKPRIRRDELPGPSNRDRLPGPSDSGASGEDLPRPRGAAADEPPAPTAAAMAGASGGRTMPARPVSRLRVTRSPAQRADTAPGDGAGGSM